MTALILFLGVIFKKLFKKGSFEEYSTAMSDKEYDEEVKKLCFELPTKEGGSTDINKIKKTIKRCHKLLAKKARSEDLYEFEKWIYENYYLLTGFKAQLNLPSIKGVPRVLILARWVLKTCAYSYMEDRVKKAVEQINKSCPLTYKEICALSDAFSFAMIEKIATLCEKAECIFKLEKLANKKSSKIEKFTKSNFLNYFKNKSLHLESSEEVLYAVNKIIVELSKIAKDCITGLSEVKKSDFQSLYSPNELLNADKTYSEMTAQTQNVYKNKICSLSDSINLNELFFTEKLLELQEKTGEHFGVFLFEKEDVLMHYIKTGEIKKHLNTFKAKSVFFTFSYFMLRIAVSVAFGFLAYNFFESGLIPFEYFKPEPLSVFNILNLPTVKIISSVLTALFSYCASARFALPLLIFILSFFTKQRPKFQMRHSDKSTAVVVSQFITSVSQLVECVKKTETLSFSSREKNIEYYMLIDTKKSSDETSELDKAILQYAVDNNINCFIRKKTKQGNIFAAKERKRGAIEDLIEAIGSKDYRKFSYYKIIDPEYVVVLDDDSVMPFEGITESVCEFEHPLNSQYDMMSFGARYNLYSLKTRYSKFYSDYAGIDIYNNSSDFYDDFIGRAVFCGKGIFKTKAYKNKLLGKLPQNKILSHDILEGGILTTGKSKMCALEDAPQNFCSDLERKSRWIRGDLQNFPFAFSRLKLSLYSRLLIIDLAAKPFSTVALTLLLFMSGLFLNSTLFYMGLSLFFAPFAIDMLSFSINSENVATRYKLRVFKPLFKAILDFFLLLFNALSNVALIFSVIARKLFKGNMLEWKTYYESQTNDALKIAKRATPSVLILTLLCVLSYFYSSLTLVGIFSYTILFAAVMIFLNSANYSPQKKTLTESQKNTVLQWAEKTYRYFAECKINGLIADNYQLFSNVGLSRKTSPTNIGFSLLADICANSLGFIDLETALESIDNTLTATEKLEKWNGHLYNWYDLDSLEKLDGFVSTVDSGNFVSALIVLSNFLKQNITASADNSVKLNCEKLKQKADDLILKSDFKILLDKTENLLYIGYNTKTSKYEGHYDLMCSEARLTTMTAIAKGDISSSAFKSLSRRHVAKYGNTMLSWSGTMFEYLMPELFLNSPDGSFLKNSVKGAVKSQIKAKCSGFFGISESGHAEVDDNMLYQYFAFGINTLSLRSGRNQCVISPYSSFLAMTVNCKKSFDNLKKLSETFYGKYGFIEAIDFSKNKAVCSFMAHHLGMSLVALTNVLKDNYFSELYFDCAKTKSSQPLLTEPICIQKGEKIGQESFVYNRTKEFDYDKVITDKMIEPKLNAHFGKYCLVINDFGEGYSYSDGTYICRQRDGGGSFALFKNKNGETYSPTFSPLKNFDDYFVEFKQNKSIFENKTHGAKMSVYTSPLFNGEMRHFKLSEKCDAAFWADLALNYLDAERGHQTFSDMMIKTEFDKDKIYASRRDGRCVCLKVKGATVKPITSKEDFFKYSGDVFKNFDFEYAFKNSEKNSVGDVLFPILGFVAKDVEQFDVIICYGKDRLELEKQLSRTESISFKDFMEKAYMDVQMSEKTYKFTQTIIQKLLFKEYSIDALKEIGATQSDIYARSRTMFYYYSGNNAALKEFALMYRAILSAGINASFVVAYHDEDSYFRPIREIIQKYAPTAYLVSENIDTWYKTAFIVLKDDMTVWTNEQYIKSSPNMTEIKSQDVTIESEFKSGNGDFTKNGYFLKASYKTQLPYSNVICDKEGGFITTNNGPAFYYAKNSRLGKITSFYQDPVLCKSCANLFVTSSDKWANLFKCNYTVEPGLTRRIFKSDYIDCTVEEYVIFEGRLCVTEVTIDKISCPSKLVMTFNSKLDDYGEEIYRTVQDTVYVHNVVTGQTALFRCIGGLSGKNLAKFHTRVFDFPFETKSIDVKHGATLEFENVKKGRYVFICGSMPSADTLTEEDVFIEKTKINDRAKNKFKIETPFKSLDILFNEYLVPQIANSRFYGRCGYYQTGGAFGFRDILQDCISYMFIDPKAVKKVILDCAAHQYLEGDVQHWWHAPRHGVRTRISDDKLFLPYVASIYADYTGDTSIFGEKIEYLTSKMLDNSEKSRYEVPEVTVFKESLLAHCEKAISNALKYGGHGLLDLGDGDWNDAIDNTKGESVWLTMFATVVLNRFKKYSERPELLGGEIIRMKKALEKAFVYDRFARIIKADGRFLGIKDSEIELDAISQAFACFANLSPSKVETALNTAFELYDDELKILKLLSPPVKSDSKLGYIVDYPEGVRENGGQYTHGAIWLMLAYFKQGMYGKALTLLNSLNPVQRLSDEKLNELYKGEPYVLPADIYSKGKLAGHMGWSWYTGSASWYYVTVLYMFGIVLNGDNLTIKPHIPDELSGSKIYFTHAGANCEIEYRKSDNFCLAINGTRYVGIDSIKLEQGKCYKIDVYFP